MKAIRRNIRRLIPLICVLFAALAAYGLYTLTAYGSRWFSYSSNSYVRTQKKNVQPGNIYDRNGTLLAGWADGIRVYQQDEEARRAMVHLLGDPEGNVANGVESFMSYYLYGFDQSFPDRVRQYFGGETRVGDSVQLTCDAALSRYIASVYPEGINGAVCVTNWKTGEVLAEMSFPNFDPMQSLEDVKKDRNKPFFNRAVQGLYAPGSTFKIVTAASALENLADPGITFNCSGILEIGGSIITDAGTNLAQNSVVRHGEMNLRSAFLKSCNNTFAQVAGVLGDSQMRKTAQAFGFDVNFLFRDLVVENSSYPTQNRTEREIAMTGIGQSTLQVTPMHMCLIASAIANGGVMMEPRLLARAIGADGKEKANLKPEVFRRALPEERAAQIREYMRAVVTDGTGTRAAVSGPRVCGKTGSAEIDGQENTNAWFVGFLDEEAHPYCLSVICENAGGGGSVAAPVAGRIFAWLLQNENN